MIPLEVGPYLAGGDSWPDGLPAHQYAHLLRRGAIEFIDTYGVQRIHAPKPILFPLSLERDIVDLMEYWRRHVLPAAGAAEPRILCLSIFGIKDFELHIDDRASFRRKPTFDRDLVTFRPAELRQGDIRRDLKPLFDALWQAAGEDRSLGYSEQGDWVEHPNERR